MSSLFSILLLLNLDSVTTLSIKFVNTHSDPKFGNVKSLQIEMLKGTSNTTSFLAQNLISMINYYRLFRKWLINSK